MSKTVIAEFFGTFSNLETGFIAAALLLMSTETPTTALSARTAPAA